MKNGFKPKLPKLRRSCDPKLSGQKPILFTVALAFIGFLVQTAFLTLEQGHPKMWWLNKGISMAQNILIILIQNKEL